MNVKNTLEKIVDYAAHITGPEEIILFGSFVNGSENVHSDIDMLIISDEPVNKKEVVARIRNFTNRYALKSDVLIYNRQRFNNEITVENSFVKAAYKSGKIVYKNGKINLEDYRKIP